MLDIWNQTRKRQWWNKISRDVPKGSTDIHSASNPTSLRSSSVMGFCIGVFEIWSSVTWDFTVDSKFSTSGEYKTAYRKIDVGNPVGKQLIRRERLQNGWGREGGGVGGVRMCHFRLSRCARPFPMVSFISGARPNQASWQPSTLKHAFT